MTDVMVIGDVCLDKYVLCDNVKPNPEVPGGFAYRVKDVIYKDGMSLNVCNNLRNFGVSCYMPDSGGGDITIKERIVHDNKTLMRVDYDKQKNYSINDINRIIEIIKSINKNEFKAIVFQDYNKGSIHRDMVAAAVATGIPVFVDPHKNSDLTMYKGVTMIKPNFEEGKALTGKTTIPEVIQTIKKVTGCEYVVLTKADEGMYYTVNLGAMGYSVEHSPALCKNIVDVTGAGDTVLAGLVYGMLKFKNIFQAVYFANKAAAVTVMKDGVYSPTITEIHKEFGDVSK